MCDMREIIKPTVQNDTYSAQSVIQKRAEGRRVLHICSSRLRKFDFATSSSLSDSVLQCCGVHRLRPVLFFLFFFVGDWEARKVAFGDESINKEKKGGRKSKPGMCSSKGLMVCGAFAWMEKGNVRNVRTTERSEVIHAHHDLDRRVFIRH